MNANKDVRNSLKKMRQHLNGEQVTESNIVKAPLLDMREMLKRARKMNEDYSYNMEMPDGSGYSNPDSTNDDLEFRIEDMTSTDKEVQKEKIQNAFDNQDVFVDIVDFKQYNDNDGRPIGFILEGGIDGVITFSLQVGKTEDLSGIDWTATPEFKADQKNNEIIERLKSYYKEFYEEYRESLY